MGIYDKWKKEVEVKFEKESSIVKRCPKCLSLSLKFDEKTGRLYCTECGFEEYINIIK